MNIDRVMYLLKIAVEHIEAFEDYESENVLKSLGFTDNDLAAIRFEPQWDDKDKENIHMVEGKIFHHGEVIWQLSYAGNEYIFSDFRKDDSAPEGYITENIPFKNYSHYFYYDETRDVYCGYAYYSPTESYAKDFDTLDDCLEWLVPERERELSGKQVENEITHSEDLVTNPDVNALKSIVLAVPDFNSFDELAPDYSTAERFEFSSPEEFMQKYRDIEEGTWCCVFVNGVQILEGCADAEDIDPLEEFFAEGWDKTLKRNDKSSLSEKIEEAKAQQKEGEISFKVKEVEKSL